MTAQYLRPEKQTLQKLIAPRLEPAGQRPDQITAFNRLVLRLYMGSQAPKIQPDNSSGPALSAVRELPLKKPKNRIFIGGLVSAVLVLTSALALYWFVYLEKFVSTDDAYVESDIYAVNSRIMGYMKSVPIKEGQFVKRADTLAVMDASDLEFEKSYKTMKVQKANVDLKRAKTLHSSSAISGFDLENAEANAKASEVDLEGTNIKLRYMKVVAPEDGYIGKKSVAPGQFVQPGQTLFVLIDPRNPWVKANFKETQTHAIRVGLPVKVWIDSFPSTTFEGHIESIYPSTGAKLSIIPAENATGNFTRIVQRVPVRIALDHLPPGTVLRPGMSARAEVDTRSIP